MVVISECFPSNHELVNIARESYRASLLLSNISESFSANDGSAQSLSAGSDRLKTILTEQPDAIQEVIAKYPGGFQDFLRNSKNHLSSSQDINDTIRSVQQIVARINARSSETIDCNLSGTESLASTVLEIIPPAGQRSQNPDLDDLLDVSEQPTEMLFSSSSTKKPLAGQTDDNEFAQRSFARKTIRKNNRKPEQTCERVIVTPIPRFVRSARTARSSKRTNIVVDSHPVQPNTAREKINSPPTREAVRKMRRPVAVAKGKYNCAPRYMDVFKAPEEKAQKPVDSIANPDYVNLISHGRINVLHFEQNWTELPVPVVTIQL